MICVPPSEHIAGLEWCWNLVRARLKQHHSFGYVFCSPNSSCYSSNTLHIVIRYIHFDWMTTWGLRQMYQIAILRYKYEQSHSKNTAHSFYTEKKIDNILHSSLDSSKWSVTLIWFQIRRIPTDSTTFVVDISACYFIVWRQQKLTVRNVNTIICIVELCRKNGNWTKDSVISWGISKRIDCSSLTSE